MTTYAKHLGSPVPQSEPLDSRQVKNAAGGFVYQLDDMKRLERFLILGSEGGTYYASERKLTMENARTIQKLVADDGTGLDAVALITEISAHGRAPKNEPALMALAIALKKGTTVVRQAAARSVPVVARTGTHLFHLAEYLKALGTWNRISRRAVQSWYLTTSERKLAMQTIKYQQRDGWSHRDLLRKTKPPIPAGVRGAIVNWMVKGWPEVGAEPHPDEVLRKIWAFERAKTAAGADLVALIKEHQLPHECVPSAALNDALVWAAMLPHMGITAIMRNLAKMTAVGLLRPLAKETRQVCDRLLDVEILKEGRVHPLHVLTALLTYQRGEGNRGSLTWTPVQQITAALDQAFYLAFKAVEPAGKRFMLGLDVSGSMDGGVVGGVAGLTPRMAAACLAQVTQNVEPQTHLVGFSHRLVGLDIPKGASLGAVCRYMQQIPMGGTDCALPMQAAIADKLEVDVFVIITDNETWEGNEHPMAALRRYRQKMGIPAKLAVIGLTSTDTTIGDEEDAGVLDMVGFDSNGPAVLADFARG